MGPIAINPIDSITVGGRVFTNTKNLITLMGIVNGAANGNSTLRKINASAGYVVPAAKSFRALAWRQDFATAGQAGLVYADADIGLNAGTAFTNPVYFGGSSLLCYIACTAITVPKEYICDFLVPTGKYLNCSNGAGASVGLVYVFGYEE